MEDEWLESPTKVKKDKKDRRRLQRERVKPTRLPNESYLSPEPAVTVTPERSSDVITGFWSIKGNSKETPEPTQLLIEDNEDWDTSSMNESVTHLTGNLQEYLLEKNPKEMSPNTAPTRLDLIHFKLNLVEALSKCKGAVGLDGGH